MLEGCWEISVFGMMHLSHAIQEQKSARKPLPSASFRGMSYRCSIFEEYHTDARYLRNIIQMIYIFGYTPQ